MIEPAPPEGIQREREVLADIPWTDSKFIRVVDKEIRSGEKVFGHYGEIGDFVVQDPGTGEGGYVQGVDFPLTMIEDLIAGLEELKKRRDSDG